MKIRSAISFMLTVCMLISLAVVMARASPRDVAVEQHSSALVVVQAEKTVAATEQAAAIHHISQDQGLEIVQPSIQLKMFKPETVRLPPVRAVETFSGLSNRTLARTSYLWQKRYLGKRFGRRTHNS